jgi:hypothetical protein
MRKLHCDGCGMSEEAERPKHKIEKVVLVVEKDARFPEGRPKYEADLCLNCQGKLLHLYFKVPAEGKLDTPAFIEPHLRAAE